MPRRTPGHGWRRPPPPRTATRLPAPCSLRRAACGLLGSLAHGGARIRPRWTHRRAEGAGVAGDGHMASGPSARRTGACELLTGVAGRASALLVHAALCAPPIGVARGDGPADVGAAGAATRAAAQGQGRDQGRVSARRPLLPLRDTFCGVTWRQRRRGRLRGQGQGGARPAPRRSEACTASLAPSAAPPHTKRRQPAASPRQATSTAQPCAGPRAGTLLAVMRQYARRPPGGRRRPDGRGHQPRRRLHLRRAGAQGRDGRPPQRAGCAPGAGSAAF